MDSLPAIDAGLSLLVAGLAEKDPGDLHVAEDARQAFGVEQPVLWVSLGHRRL